MPNRLKTLAPLSFALILALPAFAAAGRAVSNDHGDPRPPCAAPPPALEHGTYTPAKGPWRVGPVQYTCDPGYVPTGGVMFNLCHPVSEPGVATRSVWTKNALAKCVDPACPPPPGIGSGTFTPAQPPKGKWLLGDAVTYACGSGYVLGGQAKVTCQHAAGGNGWTAPPSCWPQVFGQRSVTLEVGQQYYLPLNYPDPNPCNGPTTSDPSIADGNGGNPSTMVILGKKVGKTTLQVVCRGAVRDSIPVTVVVPKLAGVYGLDSSLAMSGGELQWGASCSNGVMSAESSDPKILWIGFKSNSPGGTSVGFKAQTIAPGTVTVTFKCSGYVVGTRTITVR